jgi:hypothetical protein
MFFLIGGVQPKTVNVDERPRVCRSCGLPSARLKRLDHYLSVFFIPVLRIKKGTTFLQCDRCGILPETPDGTNHARSWHGGRVCPQCGRIAEKAFRYCPSCGQRIRP